MVKNVKESKVRKTMRQIGIRNRIKIPIENAQCLIQWLEKTHPEILGEYQKSKFFEILMRTNQYSSVMEAMHFLNTGREE